MADVQQFLTLLVEGLLVIAIPIVVAFGVQWLRQRAAEVRARLSSEQQTLLDSVISTVVRAAEQQGVIGDLKGGGAKKEYAVQMATDFLGRYGIKDLDVDKIVTLIESEVQKQFGSTAAPPDTAEARRELLDRAISVAVDAAQQSGVSGLIQNVAEQKKRYAVDFATKYLTEHGTRVAEDVISGLVEARLMQLKREVATATR